MLSHNELLENWKRFDADMDAKSKQAAAEREREILRQFYADVCTEAERIMAQTHTVSGAHWNAMKRVLKLRGVEVDG